jgi:polar amino acid transport system substrate-binding protein
MKKNRTKTILVIIQIITFFTYMIPNLANSEIKENSNLNKIQLVSIKDLVEQRIGVAILKKIYSLAGISLNIIPMPGKRAQVEVSSGRKDGEVMRIFEYGKLLSQLIRIEPPYYQLETMAFKKKGSSIIIKTKEDLKKYRIVTVRGVKHTELATKGLKNVTTVKSTRQMMKFLAAGRADIALTNTIDGELYNEKDKTIAIVKAGKPLGSFKLYHYLNKRHPKTAKKIQNQLLKLKRTGQLDEIIKSAEKSIFQQ